jgi:GH24 family phage-related lysozyme (muramidase)
MPENGNRYKAAIAAAVAIAIPAEGLRQYAYKDPVGILTVCYGETVNIDPAKKYTLDECRTRLDDSMLKAISYVDKCAPGLPVPVLAAFADAVYNLGPKLACNKEKSAAARLLVSGNYVAACNELPKWNKARVAGVMVELPGLTKRREKERQLCLTAQS